MIRAVLFDLDGTLVQTEILKAHSYARAAHQLMPDQISEEAVLEAFREVVGLPRKEVAERLMQRFSLENAAGREMERFGVATPWQAFIQVRMQFYEEMINDPAVLREYQCPYNTALLQWAHENGYRTGLATMSHCAQAQRVLGILELRHLLDFLATRDDVEHGKPHPEIYLLAAGTLQVDPPDCLVIEDSVAGVQAALNAGMDCLAVTTDYTRESIHAGRLLPEDQIIDDPSRLKTAALQRIKEHQL